MLQRINPSIRHWIKILVLVGIYSHPSILSRIFPSTGLDDEISDAEGRHDVLVVRVSLFCLTVLWELGWIISSSRQVSIRTLQYISGACLTSRKV